MRVFGTFCKVSKTNEKQIAPLGLSVSLSLIFAALSLSLSPSLSLSRLTSKVRTNRVRNNISWPSHDILCTCKEESKRVVQLLIK